MSILVLLGLFGAFQGIQGVIFNFLMAKVIPPSKRGRLTGLRNFLAGIISALVAWLSGPLPDRRCRRQPAGFAAHVPACRSC